MTSQLGNVLVTGGAGFIGSTLSRALAPLATRWIAMDSMHAQVHRSAARPAGLDPSAQLVIADVSIAADWDEMLAWFRPDTLIHLAAETGTAQSLSEATRHAVANVVGTTAMTDAFVRWDARPTRMILSSSRAVYGEGRWLLDGGGMVSPGQRVHAQLVRQSWGVPSASPLASSYSETPPSPTSVYGATKLAQEHLLKAWCGAFEVDLTVLRLQNVYGVGQSLINPYTGIVSLFSQLARRGESIPLYEDGAIVRDFVYVDDVVEAFRHALDAPSSDVVRGYDIGSGIPTTIAALAAEVAAYHGAPAPHVTGQFREGDVRAAFCTVDAAARGLNWRPEWDLARGVAALQEWIDLESTRTH